MNLSTVIDLFMMLSGEEDVIRFEPILTASMQEVRQELLDQTSASDTRLNYLAAAIANLRYTQLYGAREKALATFAGTLRRASDYEQQVRFAKQLVYSYRKLCADLLRDCDFLFLGCRG